MAAPSGRGLLVEQMVLAGPPGELVISKDPFSVDRIFCRKQTGQLFAISIPGVRRGVHHDEWPASKCVTICSAARGQSWLAAVPIHLWLAGTSMAALGSGNAASWQVHPVHEPEESAAEPADEWFYDPRIEEWEAETEAARMLLKQTTTAQQGMGSQLASKLKATIATVKQSLNQSTAADVFEHVDPALQQVQQLARLSHDLGGVAGKLGSVRDQQRAFEQEMQASLAGLSQQQKQLKTKLQQQRQEASGLEQRMRATKQAQASIVTGDELQMLADIDQLKAVRADMQSFSQQLSNEQETCAADQFELRRQCARENAEIHDSLNNETLTHILHSLTGCKATLAETMDEVESLQDQVAHLEDSKIAD